VRALPAGEVWRPVMVLVRRPEGLANLKDVRLERHVGEGLDAGWHERL